MSHAQKTLYVRPTNRKAVADAIRGIVPKLKGCTLFTQESCDITATDKAAATIRQQTLNLNQKQWKAVHEATKALVEDVYVNAEYRKANPHMPKGHRGSRKPVRKTVHVMEDKPYVIYDKDEKVIEEGIRPTAVKKPRLKPKYQPVEVSAAVIDKEVSK